MKRAIPWFQATLVFAGVVFFSDVSWADMSEPDRSDWRVLGCLAAIEHKDDRVRLQALEKLVELNAVSTGETVLKLIDITKDKLVELEAFKAFGKFKLSSSTKRTIPFLKDPDVFVRIAAARALGETGSE